MVTRSGVEAALGKCPILGCRDPVVLIRYDANIRALGHVKDGTSQAWKNDKRHLSPGWLKQLLLGRRRKYWVVAAVPRQAREQIWPVWDVTAK